MKRSGKFTAILEIPGFSVQVVVTEPADMALLEMLLARMREHFMASDGPSEEVKA